MYIGINALYKKEGSALAKMLTTLEVAQMLQVSPTTVRKWVMLGKIKSHKVNGLRRFDEAEIMAMIHGNV